MDNLSLIRLLIACGLIWLAQVIIGFFELKKPANKIIFGIVLFAVIVWLFTGRSLLHL